MAALVQDLLQHQILHGAVRKMRTSLVPNPIGHALFPSAPDLCAGRTSLLGRLDVGDRILHRDYVFDIGVGNRQTELILERHHQFHHVQAVAAKILDEPCFWRDLIEVDTHMFDHDPGNLSGDIVHILQPPADTGHQ